MTVPVITQLRTRIRDVTAKRDRAAAGHAMTVHSQYVGELRGLHYALSLLAGEEPEQ